MKQSVEVETAKISLKLHIFKETTLNPSQSKKKKKISQSKDC